MFAQDRIQRAPRSSSTPTRSTGLRKAAGLMLVMLCVGGAVAACGQQANCDVAKEAVTTANSPLAGRWAEVNNGYGMLDLQPSGMVRTNLGTFVIAQGQWRIGADGSALITTDGVNFHNMSAALIGDHLEVQTPSGIVVMVKR